MKIKITILMVITLLITSLVGCTTSSSDEDNQLSENPSFIGTITETFKGGYIVTPDEGESMLKSGDRVRIYTNESILIGDKVKVIHDGNVMESYPLKVNLISIEKVE